MRKIIQLLSKRTAPFDFSRNDDKRNHEFASLQVTKSRVEHNRESKEAQRRDPDTRADLQLLLVLKNMHILMINALVSRWHSIKMTYGPLYAPL